MLGIVIEFDYSGDETEWKAAADAFVRAIDADPRLQGRFSYQVNIKGDGPGRVHIGRWDEAETLAHLHQQDFFKTFAAQVKAFGGDSLKTAPYKRITGTQAWNRGALQG